uniref:MD-2-related lipid-recognition domain-containing protein n=1 Tax=Ascaris lumbricoides TaxID=6252 RepID=A0A9J2P664_ASCLU
MPLPSTYTITPVRMNVVGNGTLMIASIGLPSSTERHYPIDMNRIVSLMMTMNNTGVQVRQLLLDVEIFVWERLENGQCGWEKLPTFGFTDDLDGCEMMECPLEEGFRKDFRMNVDIRDGASFLDGGVSADSILIISKSNRTDDLDGCEMMECPLEEGFRKDFRMNVDIRDGASFLDDGRLYQLKMVIKNGDRPKGVRLADYVPPLLGCTRLYQLKMVIKNGDRPKGVRLADYVPPLLGCTVIQAALS